MNRKCLWYYLIAAVPVMCSLFIVAKYSTNIMIGDEWDGMLLYYDTVLKEGLSLRTLLEPHNEHELFFARIIFLLLLGPTHGNTQVFMFLTQALATVVYLLYLKYIHFSFAENDRIYMLAPIVVGIIHFDLIQSNNFLWGFQFAYYLALFGGVLAFYFFYQYFCNKQLRYLVFTNLFAAIAAYSSLQGFVSWGVLLIMQMIWFIRERVFYKRMFFSNVIICTLQIIIYKPFYSTGVKEFVFSPLYSLAELGSAITAGHNIETSIFSEHMFGASVAVVVGGVVFTLNAILCIVILTNKKVALVKVAFPFMVMAYGYGFIMITSLGRFDPSLAGASSSRYMTYALLPYIGIVILLFTLPLDQVFRWQIRISRHTSLATALTAFVCAFVLSNTIGLAQVMSQKNITEWDRENLITYDTQPLDVLTWIYPWGTIADMYAKFDLMKDMQWGVFQDNTVMQKFEQYICINFADGHRDRVTQVFFDTGRGIGEDNIEATIFNKTNGDVCSKTYTRDFPQCLNWRIDPVSDDLPFDIISIEIVNAKKKMTISGSDIPAYFELHNIISWSTDDGILHVEKSNNGDPILNATAQMVEIYCEIMS